MKFEKWIHLYKFHLLEHDEITFKFEQYNSDFNQLFSKFIYSEQNRLNITKSTNINETIDESTNINENIDESTNINENIDESMNMNKIYKKLSKKMHPDMFNGLTENEEKKVNEEFNNMKKAYDSQNLIELIKLSIEKGIEIDETMIDTNIAITQIKKNIEDLETKTKKIKTTLAWLYYEGEQCERNSVILFMAKKFNVNMEDINKCIYC